MVPTGRAGAPLLLHLLLLALAAEGLLGGRRSRTPAAETGSGKAPVRTRRGILQLAGAVYCTTGRTPLAYLRYGCYCGLGGSGWPNDDTDWCCFKHDCCYDKAKDEGCSPKTEGYSWKCKDNEAECDDIEEKCQKLACECDREAAKCLAKASYNFRYVFWPVTLCGTVSPQCKED